MAAELDRQVSGHEFIGSVGRTRPVGAIRCPELSATKQSLTRAYVMLRPVTPDQPTVPRSLQPQPAQAPEPAQDAADPSAGDAQRIALTEVISALEVRRAILGDALVDAALTPLQQRLTAGLPAAAAEPVRRLRQVSVLFVDLVGSTQLVQRLDPEAVQSVVDGALASFAAIVTRHGGEVLRYTGDNLKAAFGARATGEDDAERAVLCGLELLQAAALHGGEVQALLSARVGIHTGAVVSGGGAEKDKSLSGLAVNIAARMEQTAPAGALRISQDTWALVRGVFDAEPQAPITVKGLDEPLATWLVKAAKPRALRLPARGIAGHETPLVGRDDELQRFDAAVQTLLADRQPRSLTLLAEAGLGKSRLLREFRHRLAALGPAWWLLPARAQPSGSLQPYGLLRDLLLRRLEIADSDSADVARARFVQGLAPWLDQPHDPAPELLGQLIGLDFSAAPAVVRLGSDTRLLLDRALTALRLWLQRLAASDGSPVVLLLDDLHWADDASLDALSQLLKSVQGPVLALLGARPVLLERRADWGAALPRHEHLVLAPLGATHRAALAHSLLQRLGTVPAALATLIEQRSAGNPFYAEELVMLLIDLGAIERGSGDETDWTFHAERVEPGRLPTTLTAVLQARIDALDTRQRRALQMASVIGPVFWDDALAALDLQGPAALPALQQKALVQPRPVSSIEHTVEEAFEHHLLHQVSYGTVLKPHKREAHARAAAWLTERVGDRSDEYLAITAQHHERAGQHALAAECYERASAKAFDRSAFKAVLQYLDSAEAQLALAAEDTPLERSYSRMTRRIGACDSLALRDQQRQAIDRLLAAGEAQGQPKWVADALSSLTLLHYRLGRHEEAEAAAIRGAAVATAADEPGYGALCLGNLAWMAMEGDIKLAQEHLNAAMDLAVRAREQMRRPCDGDYEVKLLLVQSRIHSARNDYAADSAAVDRALTLSSDLNNPRIRCSCLEYAAMNARLRSDETRAALYLDEAEQLAAEFGLSLSQAVVQEGRAWLHAYTGRWDDAMRESTAAIEKFRAMAYPPGLRNSRCLKAEALWRSGRTDEAVALWEENATAYLQLGEERGARCTRLRLAEARAASGRPDDLQAALQAVQAELPAMALAESLSAGQFLLAARLAAWRVLQQAGDAQAPVQLALAEAELQNLLDGHADPAVRQRVAQNVPWHRDVREARAQADAALAPGAAI